MKKTLFIIISTILICAWIMYSAMTARAEKSVMGHDSTTGDYFSLSQIVVDDTTKDIKFTGDLLLAADDVYNIFSATAAADGIYANDLDLGTNVLNDTHLGYFLGWEHASDNSKIEGADIHNSSLVTILSLYLNDSAQGIYEDYSNNLNFFDAVSGGYTLANVATAYTHSQTVTGNPHNLDLDDVCDVGATTDQEITAKDIILTDFAGGGESIDEILDDIIHADVLDAITLTDEGGINISWTAGEIWDYGNSTVVDTDSAGSTGCTAASINYLYWDRSGGGTALTLSTTAPDASDNDVAVATINVAGGDIHEINEIPIYSKEIPTLISAFQNIFPSIVTSGLVVSEHSGGNAFDVDMTEGIYYVAAYGKETITAKDSTTDYMDVWYKSGATTWTQIAAQTEIYTTQWNSGTSLTGVTANKYYRTLFFVDDDGINAVVPTAEYDTVSQAIAGADPALPAGLTDHPKSTAVILRGNDAAFPTAAGERWIDRRPIVGADISGDYSDHGNLAGLSDDDHTQYLLADGTRDLTGAWSVTQNITTSAQLKAEHLYTTDDIYITDQIQDKDGLNGITVAQIDSIRDTYLARDGSIALTANWDAGSYEIRAQTLEADVSTGTAPFTISSTSLVANLNVDLLDSQTGGYYIDSDNFLGTKWTDLTDSGDTTLHDHDGVAENTVHRTSVGTDHGYIDQSVVIAGTPTFASLTLTNALYLNDTASGIYENDSTDDLEFYDANAGGYTLSQIASAVDNYGNLTLDNVCDNGSTTDQTITAGGFTTAGTITDGTLSIASGSITSAVNITASAQIKAEHLYTTDDIYITDEIQDGDGANPVTVAELNTAYDHSQDNTQAHTDYLLNSGADDMAGALTCDGVIMDDNHTIGWGGDESITFDGTDFQITDSLDFGTNILTDTEVGYIGQDVTTSGTPTFVSATIPTVTATSAIYFNDTATGIYENDSTGELEFYDDVSGGYTLSDLITGSGGDVSATANFVDNQLVRSDGAVKTLQSATNLYVDDSDNLGIGTQTFGTSSQYVMGWAVATKPTTNPTNIGRTYFKGGDTYAKLLLPLNEGDGATTTTDISDSNHSVTFNNNAEIDTADQKFGTSSLKLVTPNDSVHIGDSNDFDPGAGDFTIEFWINQASAEHIKEYVIYKTAGTGLYFWSFTDGDQYYYIRAYFNGSNYDVKSGEAFPGAGWHHIAYCRDGVTLRLYVDGVQKDTATIASASDTFDDPAADFYIGNTTDGRAPTCWIDEFRLSKGICRFPDGTSFTPPIAPYGDPSSAFTFMNDSGTEYKMMSNTDVDTLTVWLDSGGLGGSGSIALPTGEHITIGTTQWDDGSDDIDGGVIAADTITDLAIDWGAGANQVDLDDVVDGSSYERVDAGELAAGIYKDATDAVKGIASFDSNDFTVSSGAVSVSTTADITLDTITVTGAVYMNDTATGIYENDSTGNLEFYDDQSGGYTLADIKTAHDHSQDNTQAHTDYLLNSGADEMAGALTCDGIIMDDNHTIGWGGDESITFDGTDFQITDSLDFGTNILTDTEVGYIGQDVTTSGTPTFVSAIIPTITASTAIYMNDTATGIYENDSTGALEFYDDVSGGYTLAQLAASGGGAGSGTMTTVEEGDIQVGGADIVTLDFSDDFTVTEDPNTEINIGLDFVDQLNSANRLYVLDASDGSPVNALSIDAAGKTIIHGKANNQVWFQINQPDGSAAVETYLDADGDLISAMYDKDDNADITLNTGGASTFTNTLTSGGADPPYELFWNETRETVYHKIKNQVPDQYLNGCAIFYNGETDQMELFLPSKGEFRNLQNEKIAAVTPLAEPLEVVEWYTFNRHTGEVLKWQTPISPSYKIKEGFKLNKETGDLYNTDTEEIVSKEIAVEKMEAIR